jgi:hypothetical protein
VASVPEDSVLRRHYLASAAMQQAAGQRPSPSPVAATPEPSSAPQQGGLLGFFKRLFGG